jgi:hypothetical protein
MIAAVGLHATSSAGPSFEERDSGEMTISASVCFKDIVAHSKMCLAASWIDDPHFNANGAAAR